MSTRTRLLQAIDGMPGELLSGESIARRLGVSRTAVWKQVRALKDSGFPIEGTGSQGYRLGAPFDPSLSTYRGPDWATPHYFLSTPSTQTLAKAGAAAGLPEGHLWIAETQSCGRGRFERTWESGYGGLWFSLLLRPNAPPASIAPLSLIAGLALREAIRRVCGLTPGLKWPNDLLIQERGVWKKCAGILTEMSGQMDRVDWVAVGVGLNVNNTLTPDLARRAVSLYALSGSMCSRADLLNVFLKSFRRFYARFLTSGFAPYRSAYGKCYYASRRPVLLKTSQGDVHGTFCGVDARGAIMIKSRRKQVLLTEGEIVL